VETLKGYGLVYLATPYSKYPDGIEAAFQDASALAYRLLREGVKVYSPIAHTHPLATYGNADPYDHSIWLPFDEAIMARSDACVVAMMPSWRISKGIAHEIKFFEKARKPVHYLAPYALVL
jgi:hypothetical protein